MQKASLLTVFIIICSLTLNAQEQQKLPEINSRIVSLLDSLEGKTVYRGECWDLAKFVLNKTGAAWNGRLKFGREYNYKKHDILPGDIVQFTSAVFVEETETTTKTWRMVKHTAVVYKVLDKNKLILAEQNSDGKRFVTKSMINLDNLRHGKVSFYRPETK